jgi:two-component system sensor kinase FixL
MGELSASMAHELNQPLTAILTNAQAAQRFMAAGTADLAEFREILKDIAYDTTRARDVIRHLRALVKRSEPDFTQLDVGDTIREVVGFLHGDIVARNVRVGLELLPDLPPVHGDRIQLQQILINLLLNAFDALNGNPVAKRLVTVATAQESPQLVRVTVRDCGAGIPPDQLDSVFEPFFTTKQDGMGMGLSVTRSIVESHGGRIWAENNSAGGAAFHFTLPVVKTID